jgi:hypothetical protein
VPDNDDAGRGHARKVADALVGYARRVRILTLPGLPEKGDVTDWFARGHTLAEFSALEPGAAEVVHDKSHTNIEPENEVTYVATADGLFWNKRVQHGFVPVPLTNFRARIIAEVIEDDGVDSARFYEIEAEVGGRPRRFTIPAREFGPMVWPAIHLGASAFLYPGATLKDHARVAIQMLSGRPPERCIYTHTGWREIDGGWKYLHGHGSIPSHPEMAAVDIRLPGIIQGFALPALVTADDLSEAVRSSLQLWDLTDVGIIVQIAAYRAVLGECDFSIHLTGPTGAFKSEIAALAQQHFGPSLNAHHLPGSWSSTDNALEGMAFTLKDTLFVVDDFCPCGGQADIGRLHGKADRLLRGQGNNSGRMRMHADTSFRVTKYPRGLILSTGEDVPLGQSLRARLLILDVAPGSIDTVRLSECQRAAADGLYARALAGFIGYIAPRYADIRSNYQGQMARIRDEATTRSQHRRTPAMIASLTVALDYFLDFAVEVGAIEVSERGVYRSRATEAFDRYAMVQSQYQAASEPARRFMELLRSVFVSGRAHLAAPDGGWPRNPQDWGWREYYTESGQMEWRPCGDRIGWLDGEDILLQPDAAFVAVKRAADHGGDGINISQKTLHKRLHERGYLASVDSGRHTLTIRRTIGGVRHDVLHLRIESLTQGQK